VKFHHEVASPVTFSAKTMPPSLKSTLTTAKLNRERQNCATGAPARHVFRWMAHLAYDGHSPPPRAAWENIRKFAGCTWSAGENVGDFEEIAEFPQARRSRSLHVG
jgi:hypothetical protein